MITTIKNGIKLIKGSRKSEFNKIIILSILLGIVETIGIASIMPFLAIIENPEIIESNKLLNTLYENTSKLGTSTQVEFLILIGMGTFLTLICTSIFRIYFIHKQNRFVEDQRYIISFKLLNRYVGQDYVFFKSKNSSELSKNILSEVDHFVQNLIRPIIRLISNSFIIILIISFLIYINAKIALTVGVTFALLYIIYYKLLKGRIENIGNKLPNVNKSRYVNVSEIFGGIKEFKVNQNEKIFLHKFKSSAKNYARIISTFQTMSQVPKYLIEGLAFGMLIIISIYYLSIQQNGNSIDTSIFSILGLYALAAHRLQPAIQYIFNGFLSLKYGQKIVRNIIDDLNLKVYENVENNDYIEFKNSIILKDITYGYEKNKNILNKINITIPKNTTVGVIGETGAGKSTLIDIVMGLINPDMGELFVDDIRITADNRYKWLKMIGYVPQSIHIIDASVNENIALGIPKDKIDKERVKECAKLASADGFISKLKRSYDSSIGENGSKISGGEKQRLGIARALYFNKDILIFDEATSALDYHTELKVLENIHSIPNKTLIFITHRKEGLSKCDFIINVVDGKVILKSV